MMYRLMICFLFFVSFSGTSVFAQDVQFQSTADEMVKELTRPVMRTRGFVPESMAHSRSIRVLKRKGNNTIQKTVTVLDKDNSPKLNLKIEFDYDSYDIRRGSFPLLNELGKALTDRRLVHKNLVINGHTDSDGSDIYNLKLSLNRALSVKSYLVTNFRIDPARLETVGYGEAIPLVPNFSAANKQLNRRVEIRLAK